MTQREQSWENWGPRQGPLMPRKIFVLCFDGTGNKFQNSEGDSNILKIFRMLDRSDPNQLHYYQPGIGTYIESKSISHTSHLARMKSWYLKSKDAAVGSSFDEHVMGGYKFLMRYYAPGDDIYFFGFSRGAYVARFLAEMLDYVGLLSAGNEEMCRFAWKAFAKWQQRHGLTKDAEKKKKEMFEFLKGFRETFSRPVRRIRFLGLFDTVNSVPRFENAWLRRSKFPYTARSSAKVIRHAVGIDERRAKFRQDLISESKVIREGRRDHPAGNWRMEDDHVRGKISASMKPEGPDDAPERYRRPSQVTQQSIRYRDRSMSPGRIPSIILEDGSPSRQGLTSKPRSSMDAISQVSLQLPTKGDDDDDDADEAAAQDIDEIWFAGGHGDIGGGWELAQGEEVPLSHLPLVWIVQEARKAGLKFDYEKMIKMKCFDDSFEDDRPRAKTENPEKPLIDNRGRSLPFLEVTDATPTQEKDELTAGELVAPEISSFNKVIEFAATKSVMHDCLRFGGGLTWGQTLSWAIMEYMPFRRMDLQPDNSWKAITWPLPKGETRDIPDGAWIHTSAVKRMRSDPTYRPGNLIIGGGGRGVRIAPHEYGIGKWEVLREEGDPVGEVYVRAHPHVDGLRA